MPAINTPIEARQYVSALYATAMHEQQANWTADVATIIPSHAARDIMPYAGNPPQLTELVDSTEIKGLVTDDQLSATATPFHVDNREFAVGIKVRRRDFEDDLLYMIKSRVSQMAIVSSRYNEKLIATTINNGTLGASTYPQAKGYDGYTLFHVAHPALGAEGGTQSNLLTGTGSTITYVQVDLNTALAALMSIVADNGEPYNEGFKKVFILAPPTMRLPIDTAIRGTLIATTSNLLAVDFDVKPIYSSRLTADHSYYVGVMDVPDRGITFIDRVPPTFEALEIGSDEQWNTSVYKYRTRMRAEAAAGKWQSIVKVYNA